MSNAATFRKAIDCEEGELLNYVQDEITKNYDGVFECGNEQFIAEIDGKIVGVATLSYKDRWNKDGSELKTVFVLPSNEGQGIAIRLCEMAVRYFVSENRIPIYCDATNRKMHHVIEKLPADILKHVQVKTSYKTDGDYDVYQFQRELDEWEQMEADIAAEKLEANGNGN